MNLMYSHDDLFFQIRQFKFTFVLRIRTNIKEVKDTQLVSSAFKKNRRSTNVNFDYIEKLDYSFIIIEIHRFIRLIILNTNKHISITLMHLNRFDCPSSPLPRIMTLPCVPPSTHFITRSFPESDMHTE
jgi:hypothetical protein